MSVPEQNQNITESTFTAAADLRDKEGFGISYSGSLLSDHTTACLGILTRGGASGEICSVATAGLVMAKAGEAISVGEFCQPEAEGDFVGTAKASVTDGDYVCGIAATAAAADGEFFVMDLCCKNLFIGDAAA